MKTIGWSAAVLAAWLVACTGSPTSSPQADQNAILQQMHATWDRPDTPLEAGPVVVEGDYAVADWTQGSTGGRALLKHDHGAWITLLCAGDGIRDAAGLTEVGLPEAQARALAAKLAEAERQVAPERLARMSAFAGIVRMQPNAGEHGARH